MVGLRLLIVFFLIVICPVVQCSKRQQQVIEHQIKIEQKLDRITDLLNKVETTKCQQGER
jgi:hypothetical protein